MNYFYILIQIHLTYDFLNYLNYMWFFFLRIFYDEIKYKKIIFLYAMFGSRKMREKENWEEKWKEIKR